MTGAEFAALLKRTRWTTRELADRVGVPRSNIAAMTSGANSVDKALATYVRQVGDAMERAIDRIAVPELKDRRYTRQDC
jgi:transcriptional regulator with XRE-family HTH domain